MNTDEIYKRSLGMRYDAERLQREVANGITGCDGEFDRSNGFNEHEDLVVEVPEQYRYFGYSDMDINDERLVRISHELKKIEWRGEWSVEDSERYILLEAERAVRLEQRVIETLRSDPACGELLQVLLVDELMERLHAGEPVDELMFEEARDLAQEIASQHSTLDSEHVLELFDTMQDAIHAQRDLEQSLAIEPTPESYSFLRPPALAV